MTFAVFALIMALTLGVTVASRLRVKTVHIENYVIWGLGDLAVERAAKTSSSPSRARRGRRAYGHAALHYLAGDVIETPESEVLGHDLSDIGHGVGRAGTSEWS